MAKPISMRSWPSSIPQPGGKPTPGVSGDPAVAYFDQPGGEDHNLPLSRLGPNITPYAANLQIKLDGRYGTRGGADNLGTAASTDVCGVCVFQYQDGNDYPVRVTSTGVELYQGGVWVALSGPTLAIPSWVEVEFTVWNTLLLFTDRTSGLYAVNVIAGTYELVPGAPIAKHITTFNSRVVLSDIVQDAYGGPFPTRIEWSVKDDYTDWAGLGSGFEDLLSAPGGTVDIQQAVVPISDSEAFVVRSQSTWFMTITGYFDTPFAFSQHFAQGSNSPSTVLSVPGEKVQGQMLRTLYAQIMAIGNNDVVLIKPEGVFPLGTPIRDMLLSPNYDASSAIAVFEHRMREYIIYVPPVVPTSTSIVWRYQIDNQHWTRHVYPWEIVRMAAVRYKEGTSFDSLAGTFDSLVGPFDSLGLGQPDPDLFFATADKYVMKESSLNSQDTNSAGTAVGIDTEIWTGAIQPTGPLNRVSVIEIDIEYEATRPVTAVFEFSDDGGQTWSSFGSIDLAAVTRPTTEQYMKNIERENLMFRMKVADAGGFKLDALLFVPIQGAPIHF